MNNIENMNDRKDRRKKKGLNFLMYIFLFFVLIFVSQLPVSFAEESQKAKSETLANFDLDSQLGIIPKWELTKIDNSNTSNQPVLAEAYPFSPAVERRLLDSGSIEPNPVGTGVMNIAAGDGGYSVPGGLGVTGGLPENINMVPEGLIIQGAMGGGGSGVSHETTVVDVAQANPGGDGGSSFVAGTGEQSRGKIN